jgi:hypothetical protein
MNQLVSAAVGEKLSALMTADYLAARASRGTRKNYEAVLRKVRNEAPEAEDELPSDPRSAKRRARSGQGRSQRRAR